MHGHKRDYGMWTCVAYNTPHNFVVSADIYLIMCIYILGEKVRETGTDWVLCQMWRFHGVKKPLKCVDEVFGVNSIKLVMSSGCLHALSSRTYSRSMLNRFIHYALKNKWKTYFFDAFAFWLHLHDLLITFSRNVYIHRTICLTFEYVQFMGVSVSECMDIVHWIQLYKVLWFVCATLFAVSIFMETLSMATLFTWFKSCSINDQIDAWSLSKVLYAHKATAYERNNF